jgi:hypothetical protein
LILQLLKNRNNIVPQRGKIGVHKEYTCAPGVLGLFSLPAITLLCIAPATATFLFLILTLVENVWLCQNVLHGNLLLNMG